MAIVARWRAKLHIRRALLSRARRKGDARLIRKREAQVAEALRVIARHTRVSSVSPSGLLLVGRFEGFRSRPYRDAVGVWTIGYGETRGVTRYTHPVSEPQARAALKRRINRDYLAPALRVARLVGLELKQNEADALASLAYNTGPGIFGRGHSMGDALRSRNRQRIADAFLVYDMAGGRPILRGRRVQERRLFLR